MNCDQVKDSLVEYLLNELNYDSKTAVDRHLRQGCAGCLAMEREISEGLDALYSAIPEETLTLDQRSQIISGVNAQALRLNIRTDSTFTSDHVAASNAWTSVLPYLLAFAAGILLMMTIAAIRTPNESVRKDPTVNSSFPSSTFAVGPTTIPKGSGMPEEKNAKTLLVAMKRTNITSMIEGRILWDAFNHEVHFFGSGIASPPKGMHYVLWLMDENRQTVATNELTLDSTGRCKATAASASNKIRFVFITLESKLGGFDQPSGNVELTLHTTRFNSAPL